MVAGANIPLVVLSRGLWFKTTPPSPDAQGEARLGIGQELHRELATRSPRAELVVAKHTGHYLQNDEQCGRARRRSPPLCSPPFLRFSV